MPLHPEAAAAIERIGDLPAHLPPGELRKAYDAQRIPLVAPALPVASVRDRVIPSAGGPLAVRIYRPVDQPPEAPLMVFFHGGGWMLGGLAGYDSNCRRLAAKSGCVVVAVAYRLAPEHRFPAAVDDAWDAFRWCSANAEELGASPQRLIVCGDSAGGNLAAVVALQCREDGRHRLALQALIYPCTDLAGSWPSFERNRTGYMLTTAALRMFIEQYVPSPVDRRDPRASPMHAVDPGGVAPAIVISAEFDPLVDENEAYAQRLVAAGVPVDYHCFPGMIHPFFTLGGVVSDAARVEDLIATAIGRIGPGSA